MLKLSNGTSILLILWLIMVALFLSCARPRPVVEKPKLAVVPTFEPIIKEGIKIKLVDDKRELPIGYWAHGKLGDYLLENEKIKIIVNNVDRPPSETRSGGNIIDVASSSGRLDYFGQLYATYGPKNYGHYKFDSAYTTAEAYEKGAALIVEGPAYREPGINLRNEYIIEPGVNYLRIVSTVENGTTEPLNVKIGDTVEWGGTATFVGRHGVPLRQQRLETESEWLCGFIYNYSVGLIVKEGLIQGSHYMNTSDLIYKTMALEPGEMVSCERYLVVADRSIAKISDFAWQLRGEPVGYITGQVLEMPERKPLAGIDVQVRSTRFKGEKVKPYPYTRSYTDETGTYRIALQEGKYYVQPAPFGRHQPRYSLSIPVPPGGTHVMNLQVSPPIKLKFRVTDADSDQLLPCKLTFINIPETKFVDFGPPYQLPGSGNTYYSASGEGELIVPAGKYHIVISRGIEYDIFEKEMTISFASENHLEAKLKRVIDTPGYISADIGVKTANSYNSLVTPRDRVIAAAAEGVEYLVSADSNVATDFSPVVEELKLEPFINSSIGKEIDFWGANNMGSFLVFPLSQEQASAESGAEEVQANSGEELLALLREQYPEALIQVNHPLSEEEGYFQKYGYNLETGELGKSKGFSFDFDLLTLWEGKRMMAKENALKLYHQLLHQGQIFSPSGHSNSRFIYGEETGYPRVYIASPTDEPSQIKEPEIIQSLKQGKIIITNGPFVQFTINGQGPGSLVTDTDGSVDTKIKIWAPSWVDVYNFTILQNGEFGKQVWFAMEKVNGQRYPRPGSTKKGIFTFQINQDTAFTVIVTGRGSLEPVVSQISYPENKGTYPYAFAGPVFVDFDGNGKFDLPQKPVQ